MMNCIIYWPYLPDWATNPTSHADVEFYASTKISDPAILQQSLEYSGDVGHYQVEAKGEVCKMKLELYKQAAVP